MVDREWAAMADSSAYCDDDDLSKLIVSERDYYVESSSRLLDPKNDETPVVAGVPFERDTRFELATSSLGS